MAQIRYHPSEEDTFEDFEDEIFGLSGGNQNDEEDDDALLYGDTTEPRPPPTQTYHPQQQQFQQQHPPQNQHYKQDARARDLDDDQSRDGYAYRRDDDYNRPSSRTSDGGRNSGGRGCGRSRDSNESPPPRQSDHDDRARRKRRDSEVDDRSNQGRRSSNDYLYDDDDADRRRRQERSRSGDNRTKGYGDERSPSYQEDSSSRWSSDLAQPEKSSKSPEETLIVPPLQSFEVFCLPAVKNLPPSTMACSRTRLIAEIMLAVKISPVKTTEYKSIVMTAITSEGIKYKMDMDFLKEESSYAFRLIVEDDIELGYGTGKMPQEAETDGFRELVETIRCCDYLVVKEAVRRSVKDPSYKVCFYETFQAALDGSFRYDLLCKERRVAEKDLPVCDYCKDSGHILHFCMKMKTTDQPSSEADKPLQSADVSSMMQTPAPTAASSSTVVVTAAASLAAGGPDGGAAVVYTYTPTPTTWSATAPTAPGAPPYQTAAPPGYNPATGMPTPFQPPNSFGVANTQMYAGHPFYAGAMQQQPPPGMPGYPYPQGAGPPPGFPNYYNMPPPGFQGPPPPFAGGYPPHPQHPQYGGPPPPHGFPPGSIPPHFAPGPNGARHPAPYGHPGPHPGQPGPHPGQPRPQHPGQPGPPGHPAGPPGHPAGPPGVEGGMKQESKPEAPPGVDGPGEARKDGGFDDASSNGSPQKRRRSVSSSPSPRKSKEKNAFEVDPENARPEEKQIAEIMKMTKENLNKTTVRDSEMFLSDVFSKCDTRWRARYDDQTQSFQCFVGKGQIIIHQKTCELAMTNFTRPYFFQEIVDKLARNEYLKVIRQDDKQVLLVSEPGPLVETLYYCYKDLVRKSSLESERPVHPENVPVKVVNIRGADGEAVIDEALHNPTGFERKLAKLMKYLKSDFPFIVGERKEWQAGEIMDANVPPDQIEANFRRYVSHLGLILRFEVEITDAPSADGSHKREMFLSDVAIKKEKIEANLRINVEQFIIRKVVIDLVCSDYVKVRKNPERGDRVNLFISYRGAITGAIRWDCLLSKRGRSDRGRGEKRSRRDENGEEGRERSRKEDGSRDGKEKSSRSSHKESRDRDREKEREKDRDREREKRREKKEREGEGEADGGGGDEEGDRHSQEDREKDRSSRHKDRHRDDKRERHHHGHSHHSSSGAGGGGGGAAPKVYNTMTQEEKEERRRKREERMAEESRRDARNNDQSSSSSSSRHHHHRSRREEKDVKEEEKWQFEPADQ